MKTLVLVLSIAILSEQAFSQQFSRQRPRVSPAPIKNLEVQSTAAVDTVGVSSSSDIVELDGFSLQQYIMRGRGPKYRGTKVTISKEQVLSIKVDFGRSDYSWLFAANGNGAFTYQNYIYQVSSLEGQEELGGFRARYVDAMSRFGRGSSQLRDAFASLVRRNYLDNRYSVYVSSEKGALRNDASCIIGASRTDFKFQQRPTQAAHSGDCADVRQNKVWYINITLNHCDYVASFTDASGVQVDELRSDAQCEAEFSLYQDLLYFN